MKFEDFASKFLLKLRNKEEQNRKMIDIALKED
jgi:hypothetical protein